MSNPKKQKNKKKRNSSLKKKKVQVYRINSFLKHVGVTPPVMIHSVPEISEREK
jgi:hypothetical protein